MEFHERLSFTVSVLLVLGVVLCARAYYIGGLPRAKETAAVWFVASVVAILLGRWLRRTGRINK